MHSIQYLKYKMSIKFVQNGKIIIQSSYPDITLAWLHDDTNEEETRNIRNATLFARTASGFQTEFVFTKTTKVSATLTKTPHRCMHN